MLFSNFAWQTLHLNEDKVDDEADADAEVLASMIVKVRKVCSRVKKD